MVTAGIARKPGMSRDDLVKTNAGIVRSVGEQIRRVAPKAIVVVVSNPLDVMCYVAMRATGFPRERVIGMAGVLDTARYRMFLAEAMQVSVEDIQAMVLGGHGDTMVPLVSYTTVSGIPVSQLIDQAKLDAIVDRTRNGGAEIVAFLKTGSAYYAPSAAAVQMVEAIALDKKRILPCSAWLQGEYGLKDVFCGVPCKLGRRGLEQIIDIKLTDEERAALTASAEAVRADPEGGGRVKAAGDEPHRHVLGHVGRQEGGHGGHRADPGGLPDHPRAGQSPGLHRPRPDQSLRRDAPRHGRRALGGPAGAPRGGRSSTSWPPPSSRCAARRRGRWRMRPGAQPQVSTLASRTIRWGGALLLVFIIFHILHFTTGTVHPDFVELDPYHNVDHGVPQSLGRAVLSRRHGGARASTSITACGAAGGASGVSPPSPTHSGAGWRSCSADSSGSGSR